MTLIGNVEFIEERELKEAVWKESDRRFFSKGIDDPKFWLLKFHTIEQLSGLRENLEHVSTGKEKIAVEIVAGIYLSAEPDRLIGLAEMFDYKKEQTR